MAEPIGPLREADLPDRTQAFWKMTGPGAVMVGMSIGAGELIVWPWITAKFGASMVWAAALGVFLQLWINIEIGRWAVATGESLYTAYARLWRGFVPIFLLINFVLVFLPGWARSSGVALKALLFGPDGPGPDWFWTAVTFAAIACILFGPPRIYQAVERTVSFLVILIVAGLIFIMFKVASFDLFAEMGRGLLNVGHIQLDDEFTFARFFGAVVFAGAGGLGNIYYVYYLRDKQIGMGARMPKLLNPLRTHEESHSDVGYAYPETESNIQRFKEWFRYVVLDQTLYFWFLNTFTMFLFMFGALAVLYPLGLVPGEGQLVWDLASILEESMGISGRYLFLTIGMAALFTTQLTVVDGGARTFVDLIHTNFSVARKIPQAKMYLAIVAGTMLLGVASTWLFETFEVSALGFILNSALISGFAMAVYCPLTLYVNLRYLPKSARPKPLNIVMVGLASAVYISFACYTLYDMIF